MPARTLLRTRRDRSGRVTTWKYRTRSSMGIDSFVGDPGGPFCDPQVQWDATAGRWLYSVLFCNTSTSAQVILFGWSKTSNPSNLASGWCTNMGFDTSPLIFDFDKLG